MVVAEGVKNADRKATENDSAAQKEAREIWSVYEETVLELGAGAALPSLIYALANTSLVVATDHPSSPALTSTIEFNLKQNL
ncbi:uncharacterized protein N7458_005924 [Penicillium daleae]|uniref:Uncharacterized protein n=1 Tax=Penicillium daleae TaxID=63821 RepID=A0AAD6C3S2_9EURO|nr:uncharacterized protein N7458_005924 [Penicillium daleae]KAJ5449475.1 hypothetical protein N7458_005924 [Penicillium daleae]